MLFFIRKKLISSNLFHGSFIVIVLLTTLIGCQTIDHKSPVTSSPEQSYFSQQDTLDAQIAKLEQREEALIAREEAIRARESELVTLFSELLKQKKQLENQPTQQQHRTNTITSSPKPPVHSQSTTHKTAQTSKKTGKTDNRTILGGLEYVYLDPPGMNLSARIDTGAQTSSLNALDVVEFERDGKPYIKFNILDPDSQEKIEITRRLRGYTKIKKHKTESQRRPIVRLRVKLGDLDEHISFTLIDRSKFKQQVLIGRNFLRDLAIVDVSKEFTVPKFKPDTQ